MNNKNCIYTRWQHQYQTWHNTCSNRGLMADHSTRCGHTNTTISMRCCHDKSLHTCFLAEAVC